MVYPTNAGWIHAAFDTLTGLFDRLGLRENINKTVGTVCHPFRAAVAQADEAYTRQMTGEGRSYKES